MKNKKRIAALFAATVMIVSSLAGCGSKTDKPEGTQEAKAEKVLKFGCAMYSDGMVDSIAQTNGAWNAMRYGVSESLFKFDDSMNAKPCLAEKMEESEDHKTFVITLKDGIKFSDGCEVTATKVKESIERGFKEGPNGTAAPNKFLPYDSKITADDAKKQITIETTEPTVNLAGRLANPVMAIFDIEHTTDFTNGAIGTGPYAIESFTEQVGYELVANKNYREKVPYDKVSILFMGDASAKANALKNGQVDIVENITNVADISEFKNDDNYTVDITTGIRTGFSYMNQNGVLANKELRKAILMGIDYDAICNSNTIGGLYVPGFAVLPSSTDYGYDKLTNPYKYNVEEAKATLDKAGIVDKDGDGIREIDGKNINLTYVSYENRLLNEFSDAHTQYLKEIGIGITPKYGSSDDQWKALTTGDYDINNNNWTTVGTGDPLDFLANWYSEGDADYCGYKNSEFDKLYKEFLEEFDMDKRKELVVQMQQILIDDAVAIIDGYYSSSMIYSKNVGKAHISTADYYWITSDIIPAE